MSVASPYIMTEKIKQILEARGYNLICKICECPILVGDEVESKPQRRGKKKTKLYHAKCYENSEFDSKCEEETDEEIDNFFAKPKRGSRKALKKRHKLKRQQKRERMR